MTDRPFKQVDVFTTEAFRGNPLAVVMDGRGLSTDAMQRLADWTNLSETTFVLPATQPGADYRVRIFSPGRELPFAGHPTLGTCHAWLEDGGAPAGPEVVQECGAGLVRIRRGEGRLAFAAPPLNRSGPLEEFDLRRIALALKIDRVDILHHAWCDNGPGWHGVMLRSAAQVMALRPDATALGDLDLGVVGAYPEGGECAFEVRAFFSSLSGMTEDPVTGSLNAALGQWLIGAGLAPARYVASQGTALGRAGRVHVERDAQGQVWVGGAVVTCVRGTVAC